MFSFIPRAIFRTISWVAAAIFLFYSTIYIFYNFGFFWTFAAYFTFPIGIGLFPVWGYLFFDFFDPMTNTAWLITVIEAIYRYRYERKTEIKAQIQLEKNIEEWIDSKYGESFSIVVFPFADSISKVSDSKTNEVLISEDTNKFVTMTISLSNFEILSTEFSKDLDNALNAQVDVDPSQHQKYLFNKAISSWAEQLKEQFLENQNFDLTKLRNHQFVTGDKFVVGDTDSKFYLAGDLSDNR